MNIGKRIAYLRKTKGLTKSQLAKFVNVSPAYITMLENGKKTNVSTKLLIKIANVLDISVNEILNEYETKEKTLSEYSTDELLEEIRKRIK